MLDYQILDIEKYESERGAILNFLRREELDSQTFGQIYVIGIRPGKTRGNHYHKEKQEWIVVTRGSMEVRMKGVDSGESETVTLSADAAAPKKMRIGPGVAHSFTNNGDDEAVFVEYSTWLYDPEKEDIYKHEV